MTGLWSVILPETAAVTNLITNPSFEINETGWVNAAGITTTSTYQRRGYKSCALTCTTAVYDGTYFDAVTLVSGTTYTFAVDVRGADAVPYHVFFADTAGTAVSTYSTFTGSAQWTREAVTYASTANANFRVYVRKNNSESVATFYIDGAGVYALDHDPGHIDGSCDDCKWTGAPHASTSIREAGSATGGEVTNFDDLYFYTHEWPGAGMAEVEPLLQSIGALPGALDVGEKIKERVFTIVGQVIGTSQTSLHSRRKALINSLKSDRVKDKQPVTLVYSGGNSERPVRIKGKYIGGLTMGAQDGFSERMGLRFVSSDPFWYEDGVEGAALTVADTVADGDYVIKRIDGVWSNVSTNFNSWVTNIVKDKGKVYLGGFFTDVGDANGDYILSYDSAGVLASLGTGLNDACRALAVAPNGNIYAGGYFTSAGGVANTSMIALWDTSTMGWKEVGGGLSNDASTANRVQAIAIDNNGSVYAGGFFKFAADTATQLYLACYSSTGWGALTIDGGVYALAVGRDGYIYVGGDYNVAGSDTDCVNIARWTGTAWQNLGTGTLGGATNYVKCMVFDNAGNLYIGGDFTSVDGVSANYVAMYDGVGWHALGSGLNGICHAMYFADGLLYCGGEFTTAGGLALSEKCAVWNGSTWATIPFDIVTSNAYYAIYADTSDLYLGGDISGGFNSAYINTLTNTGTAIAYPKFHFEHADGVQVRIVYIKNLDTGATLWLDYYLQQGEILEIDTTIDKRTVTSSMRGNVIGSALLRNSDFSDFYLLPGANRISVFVTNSTPPTSTVYYATWPITHWSLDGSST